MNSDADVVNLGALLELDSPYQLTSQKKQAGLTEMLSRLDSHHYQHCDAYRNLVDALGLELAEQSGPLLPVRLFKEYDLKSVPEDAVIKTLTSSGTTSSKVSRIFLDRQTSGNQSKVLVRIMQHYLGKARLPMLIIDHPGVVKDRRSFSARGAGILGLSTFGRGHTYALDDDMNINFEAIDEFLSRFEDQPVFIFGFTFMVWQYFLQELKAQGRKLNLPNSVLIHSGGWKKLQDRAVDNETFKAAARELAGIERVHNFYGMVEQVGSVFVECQEGYLHSPVYSDITILDPFDMKALPAGEKGVVAVESALPSSYPGHRLLTEDLGTVMGEDDCGCGRKGKYFLIHGRLAKAEARGCSDTHTSKA
ncbi:MAG: hypothetical protein ACR2PT_05020 [Endozoicomonas sp.]